MVDGPTMTSQPRPVQSIDQVVSGSADRPPATGNNDSSTTVAGLEPFQFSKTQQQLAFRLLWVMIGVIFVIVASSAVYSATCFADGRQCASATSALSIITNSLSPIFTAMVGLVGSVIGFYFGSKQQ